MKNTLRFTLIIAFLALYQNGYTQGWVAEIDIDVNHSLYALEKISNARITFSGVTTSGSSNKNQIHFVLNGNGTPTGNINLSVSGLGYEPYNRSDPYSKTISATFSGNYKTPCITGFFQQTGVTPEEQVYIRIKINPRLEIANVLQGCDNLVLTTNSCSPSFVWEVSESLTAGYKIISGKQTSSISITREELAAIGFNNLYGRKYFRVTGYPGTTSLVQPLEIFYPGPTATLTGTSPKCHNGRDGTIRLDITSPFPGGIDDYVVTLFEGVPPENPRRQEIVNNGSVMIFSDLLPGNYWIRIENHSSIDIYGSCWTDYAVAPLGNPEAVTIPSWEISDYNGYPVKCAGGNQGTIKATPSGGTGTYTSFEWTPNVSTTAFAGNLPEGIYQVKAKDSNDCWSEVYSHDLTAPEKLVLELSSSGGRGGFDVSCHDKQDGSIETNVTGGIGPYTYAWSGGSATPSLTRLGPGTYPVTVTDANGCAIVESLTLKAPDPIDFSIGEISGIKCPGDHSGILEVQSPVNTIGQHYYTWSSGETGSVITDKAGGTYSVSVSDDQGCSAQKSHTLADPPSYSIEIHPASDYHGSPVRCNGEGNGALTTLIKDGNNNSTTAEYYTWFKDGSEWMAGSNLTMLEGLTAGSYKVEIVYKGLCKAENTFVLDEPPPVIPVVSSVTNFHGFPVSCQGSTDGILKASAQGGTGSAYIFTWAGGPSGPELSGLGAGQYVVTAKDVNGCAGTAKTTLNEPGPVNVGISILSDFNGQALTCYQAADAQLKGSANGGTGSFFYAWNTGQKTQDLTNVPAGIYTLTATDANGCKGVADITLVNPLPVKALIPDLSDYNGFGVSCQGSRDGYLLSEGSGGAGGYAFRWLGSSFSGPLINNLGAGSYSVVVTDKNGCADTATSIITTPGPLVLEVLEIKNISCHDGKDGEIKLRASGGAGHYEYSSDGLGWQKDSTLRALKAGTFFVTMRDANGCLQTREETLTQPAVLSIDFKNIEPAYCNDPRGKVSAVVTGGTGDYLYRWTDAQDRERSQEATLTGLHSGVFTLKVLDEHLCEVTGSVGITSTDGPKAQISNMVSVTCYGSSDGRASLEISGGLGPYTFLWPDGQETAEGINLGKGLHLVVITDSNNCSVVESVTIPAPAPLEIDLLKKETPSCDGDCNGSLLVMARGGNNNYRYDWENSSGAEASHLCAGQYSVQVADEKGCISTKTFNLEQPESLDINLISAESPRCRDGCNGKLEVEATGGTGALEYAWSNGEAGRSIHNLCAGPYISTVTDANGCSLRGKFVLENPPGNALDLGGSITLCAGQTHLLDAGSSWISYKWSGNTGFTSSAQQVTIAEAGLYWLEVVSDKGCVVQDTFKLDTSRDLLKANFLLTTQAMAGDTVVMIDISWPLPEQVLWKFPEEMKRLGDAGDAVYGQFEKSGLYEVSLTAISGECRDDMYKTITVINREDTAEVGRLGNVPFLKEFTLYPNPNDGMFDVEIEFMEESALVLTVLNNLMANKIGQIEDSGKKSYRMHIDLRPMSAGSYTLRLDYGKGTKYIRFIVK